MYRSEGVGNPGLCNNIGKQVTGTKANWSHLYGMLICILNHLIRVELIAISQYTRPVEMERYHTDTPRMELGNQYRWCARIT